MLSIHKKKALAALALLLLVATASALYQSKKEFGSTADSPSSSLSNKPVPPVKLYATASRGAMVKSKLALGSSIVAEDSGVIVDVDYDRGWFDIQFNNLPALTDARFLATGFANVFSMSNVPASPFPVSTGSILNVSPLQFFPNSTAENKLLRIYARVTTSSPLGRAEVLVTDSSGTTICSQIAAVGVDAVCDSTVQVALTGTGAAQIFTYRAYGANSGAVSTTKLRAAVMDASDFDSGFSGPAKAAALETLRARYFYNHRVTNRGDEQMRIIRVYSSPGVLVKEFPVITRWNGKSYAALPLLGFPGSVPYQMSSTFVDREIVDRAFVDVPVNAQSVTFRAARRSITPSAITAGMPRDVDLYLQHDVGPNDNSVVPPIPFQTAPISVTTTDSTSSSSDSITLNVTPGRWYVIGKSKTGEAMHLNLSATFNTFGPPPAFKFGHYFNPSRPGHGVYLDKVSGQWILLWYTYLEDGTPTWYIAQAAAPNEDQGFSIWEASVRRVVWNGNSTFSYTIGSVRVTLLGDSSFQFNYILDGEAGGETFTRLGSPGCVTSRGSNFDVSGLWYSPSKSGFGYSTEIISGQEFIPTYLFDQNGMPRWLIGQKSFVDGVSTIDMKQLSGFCPLCVYRATTSQMAGSMSRTITATAAPDNSPGYSNMGVSAGFAYPLRGNWNENLPAALLTDRKSCQ
jgi:hypothetical protein